MNEYIIFGLRRPQILMKTHNRKFDMITTLSCRKRKSKKCTKFFIYYYLDFFFSQKQTSK